ncbi:MAG: CDP-alcohol phosphatidyltransferase family protein [Phycisphaerae bacterium]|nr:CDP-alcohol phosphatidyltransferase family protein [Phycisphaerae bacterium]
MLRDQRQTERDKRRIERVRRRSRRLRSLAFLPTLITLGNLICGFAAIYFGLRSLYEFGAGLHPGYAPKLPGGMLERLLPSFLSVGAGMVLLGMILDMFDGLVARATRSTTNFGGQLDSLADVVTCGVAPAMLMIAFMTQELAGDAIVPSPISEHLLGRVSWLAAAVYVAFAAVRLARYNVEHAEVDFDPKVFRGLPSPGAAAIVVSLILLQDQLGVTGRHVVAYALPALAVASACLMVSRIPYRRFYRAYLLGRTPVWQLLSIVLLVAVFFSFKAPTLVALALWYGASGPVWMLARKMRTGTTSVKVVASASDEQRRQA